MLGDKSLQIKLVRQREQFFPALLEVTGVQDTLGIPPDDGTEAELAFDQWQVTEIRPGAPQQIEGNEARLGPKWKREMSGSVQQSIRYSGRPRPNSPS